MKKWVGPVIGVVVLIAIIILIFISLKFSFPKACTLEAKICSDGSVVARDSFENCEFEDCPKLIECASTSDCGQNYTCLNKSGDEGTYCYVSSQLSSVCIYECASSTCSLSKSDPMRINCGEQDCAKEGEIISIMPTPDGSKHPECCEGLDSAVKYSFINNTCHPLMDVGICINCGDGTCNSSHENKCNCPQDCNKSIKYCNDYPLPQTDDIIQNCTCPQGKVKYQFYAAASCVTDSKTPCNSHEDCPSQEKCISGDGRTWKCTGKLGGCYYGNPDDTNEQICVD